MPAYRQNDTVRPVTSVRLHWRYRRGMLALREIMIWIIQAVLFGIGIGFAGLTAHLAGPLCLRDRRTDPDRDRVFRRDGGPRLDRKQVLARRMAFQSPALTSVAMASVRAAASLSRYCLGAIDLRARGFDDPALERSYKRLRAFDRKMRAQRRLISPLLEEEQPHRVLAVDMHIMRDAAWLLARALDMLQARAEHIVECLLARQNTARYENHAFPRCAPARVLRAPFGVEAG